MDANRGTARSRFPIWKFAALTVAFLVVILYVTQDVITAFGTYADRIPNFSKNSCTTCHGDQQSVFKPQFASTTPTDHTYTTAFANLDPDGDGFTTGEELQDPTGAWRKGDADPGNPALVSIPSSLGSFPPAPTMASFTGINAGSTVTGTRAVAVGLSTTAGGNPVGITRVDYTFRTPGTSTIIATFTSSTAPFNRNIDTTLVANGTYDVVATVFDKRSAGAGGTRTAAQTVANVTVSNAPQITAQPSSILVAPGDPATFTVTASGGTLTYQWRKAGSNLTNGGTISGATTATLSINPVVAANAGMYDVVISNGASTTSAPATLSVGSQTSNSNVRLASATAANTAGNANSSVPNNILGTATTRPINGDGRYVVFRSTSSDLSVLDGTATQDLYRRDLRNSVTELVTVNSTNTGPGSASSDKVMINVDGRYVGFTSSALNLTAVAPVGAAQRCYRRDMQSGVTIPIGVKNGAVTQASDFGTSNSEISAMSGDGRYILFFYDGATQLDPTKANTGGGGEYYLRDCVAETTTLVCVNSAGTGTGNAGCTEGVMSIDGRYVAFSSTATDLVSGVADGNTHVYRWDRSSPNGVALVDAVDGTTATAGNANAFGPAINSDDGRYIAFISTATNLNTNDSSATATIFRRDMNTNDTEIVNEANNASAAGNGCGDVAGDQRQRTVHLFYQRRQQFDRHRGYERI
jgi:hypothetical protein